MTRRIWIVVGLLAVTAGVVGVGMYFAFSERSQKAAPLSLELGAYVSRPLGRPAEGIPWITDLVVTDLDQDGRADVLVCDARRNRVGWLRQVRPGEFVEEAISEAIAGPAQVNVADMNGDGHLDILVASMGVITPNNDPIGAVVVLVNDGSNRFHHRVLLQDVARVTYVAAADFNEDGLPDLIVGQFGYLQGEIRWLENQGNWDFRSHVLSDLPGTIHAPAGDLDGDGHLDVVALISQDVEEVHAFFGDGAGGFRQRVLFGSTNTDYGSSGLVLADVNQDGRPDIVYTNGDGFDYATPGSRPWHGVQWLENRGNREFAFHRIGDFPGAYSPVVVDLDADGDHDIVVCSGFNDWADPRAVSLVVFENDGAQAFARRDLAHAPTHLIAVRAADLLGDGRIEMVTGSLGFYPPYDRAGRIDLWQRASR